MDAMLLDRLKPVVDKTIEALGKTKFRLDPIGGARFPRQTSIISSAYKRHGQILELAIRERLSDCSYFDVWHEPAFKVSDIADRAIQGRNSDIPDGTLIELPYGDAGREIQVDVLMYDRRVGTIRSYEIKRGNGHFDAGKKRSLLRDLLCTQALLKSYSTSKSLSCSIAEARVICYYGVRALPEPLSLIGPELDDHFVFAVHKQVEAVNEYFRDRLYALLETGTGAPYPCESCPFTDVEGQSQLPLH